MSDAQQQLGKRRRQHSQEQPQQQYYHQHQSPSPPPQMNDEFVPNSSQMQQDLMTYQSWLKDQLRFTAFLQQNGPVAQYMKMQQNHERQPHSSQNNGLQNRRHQEPDRGSKLPPGRDVNRPQKAGKAQKQQKYRHVATWTSWEPEGPPRTYFSTRPWKSQMKASRAYPDEQCTRIFKGSTITSFLQNPHTSVPPEPEPHYCQDCGGVPVNKLRHKQSRAHRETTGLDISQICSRIRRDPAFASAVIAAARECIENSSVEDSASDDSDDNDGCGDFEGEEDDYGAPPSKQPRPSGSKPGLSDE